MFFKKYENLTEIHSRTAKLEYLEQGGMGIGLDNSINGTN